MQKNQWSLLQFYQSNEQFKKIKQKTDTPWILRRSEEFTPESPPWGCKHLSKGHIWAFRYLLKIKSKYPGKLSCKFLLMTDNLLGERLTVC
jgi:hypothetical protein